MSLTVTVGGTTVSGVTDITYSTADTDEIGVAEITAKNSATNRGFSYGEAVVVKDNGAVEWTGNLEGKPKTGSQGLTVTLKARSTKESLQYVEVHRPFYEMDPGAIIREAINNQVVTRNTVTLFDGTTPGDWKSDANAFETLDIDTLALAERGGDILFMYLDEDTFGTFTARHTSIPASAVIDKQMEFLRTRLVVNNPGGVITGEVELRDDDGNQFVWDLEIPDGADFTTYRLPTEEATSDGNLSTNNQLEYRFTINGTITQPRAIGLDYALTKPFATKSRSIGIGTSDVQDSGRTITRRFDTTLFDMVNQLSTEDKAIARMDALGDLEWVPSGTVSAPSITDSTRVVDAEVNKDATNITNRVTVEGADSLQVTLKDPSSINFYGVSPREDSLVDRSIQTESELRQWGEGYLEENAWEDTALEYTVVGSAFRTVMPGQEIYVNRSFENVTDTFEVTKVNRNAAGRITISMTGTD